MMSTADTVRGLRAAAKVTGWSRSGLAKVVDAGRIPVERNGRTFTFKVSDLQAIRRGGADAGSYEIAKSSTAASTGVDHGVSSVSADVPGTPERPPAAGSAPEVDSVASIVFADLQAGHDLRQIVIDHKLSPEVVRAAHAEWWALSTVDIMRKPEAEARLAQVEAATRGLADRLTEIEGIAQTLADQAASGLQGIETRLRGLEMRGSAARSAGPLIQRVEALEQLLRSLPAAPLLLDRRCPGCGHALVVAAACSGCRAGLAT